MTRTLLVRILFAWVMALFGLFPVQAQAPIASFPPGTFQNRAPLDPAAGGGGGTVTFDAKTTTAATATGTSVSTSGLTMGAGGGGAIVVGYWIDSANSTPAALACAWDPGGTNQAFTAITGTNTGVNGGISGASVLFGLLAPTAGNKTLTCSWTGSSTAAIVAVSFTGVNQGSIAAAFPNGNFSSATTAAAGPVSVTVTSATGHQTVGLFAQNCVAFGAVSGTTIAPELDMANMGVISSYSNGAATVTMTAAFTGTCVQIASGTDVAP